MIFLQTIGLTAALSDEVPVNLSLYGCGPLDWNYGGTSLYNNGSRLVSGLPDLIDLKPNDRVGFLPTSSGDLHIFVNGHHMEKVSVGWAQSHCTRANATRFASSSNFCMCSGTLILEWACKTVLL